MESLDLFNGLNGAVVSRDEINRIIDVAKTENQSEVIYRLSKILNRFPLKKRFEIELLEFPTGLNAARHTGRYKHALDDCGRLRPGYKFEGGAVIKVVKKQRIAKPRKEKCKIEKKAIPNKPASKIVGYAIVDNINGEIIASKKDLPELKKLIPEIRKEFFKDLPPLIYEVENSKGKNVLGKKINIEETTITKRDIKQSLAPHPNYKYQKIISKWFIDNAPNSLRYKTAVLLLSGIKNPDDVLQISNPDHYSRILRSLESIDESSHEMAWRTENYSIAEAEKWTVEKLEKIFVLSKKNSKQAALKSPIIIPETQRKITVPDYSSKYKTAVDREIENNRTMQLYNITGDLAKFLGKIEIKPLQSLAITLDSPEGGGKTHTIYQWANDFCNAGYRPIIWSLEEHASSGLSTEKAKEYFGSNISCIPIESERENESNQETLGRFFESIADFDVILIDSWTKIVELDTRINFDQDLRKKFNGKLFIVIIQRNADGTVRGGSKVGFDGDIVLKANVDRADFRNNYIYNHKNRYNDYMPISELKYSPYKRALIHVQAKPESIPEQASSSKLSFVALEQ